MPFSSRLRPAADGAAGRAARLLVGFALLVVGVGAIGCESDPGSETYAARVGSYTLSQGELDRALQGFSGLQDTSEARRQIIEQWVTRTLLLREALRTNLDQAPAVQERLEEQRRSVLVTALTNRLYEEAEVAPSPADIQDYFARHREQLRLRQPYVQVRHLAATRKTAADSVHRRLREASPVTDSLWTALTERYATSPERSQAAASRFLPTSRAAAGLPYLEDLLTTLDPGEVSSVVRDDSLFHVVQLVDRVAEGRAPKLEWVEPQIRRRLQSRARKQMYAREVQRLRNQARARGELDIR
jgi:hypothetical protein